MTQRSGKKPARRTGAAKRTAGRKSKPRKRRKAPAKRRARPRRRYYGLAGAGLAVLLAPIVTVLVWGALPGPGTGRQVELDWPETPTSASSAGERLERAGLIKSPRLFAAYLVLVHPSLARAPGPHLFADSLPPRDLVRRLARLGSRPKVRLTVPEGYNYIQVGQRLQQRGVCSARAFGQAVTNRTLLESLRISGPSAEGYLFPATYTFRVDDDPKRVLQRLVGQTRRRLRKLDRLHRGALSRLEKQRGWSEHELLTLASIIERETGHSGERRKVASVYYNRLDDPDFRPLHTLQADPTAGYGCLVQPDAAASCAGYSGRITPAMLRDPDNPYNTYRHPGLPPGPIASPGERSIAAAIDPAHTDYLFFVANGAGGHTFSRTFNEHNAAIRQSRHDAGP